jgi:hypothetical protein
MAILFTVLITASVLVVTGVAAFHARSVARR